MCAEYSCTICVVFKCLHSQGSAESRLKCGGNCYTPFDQNLLLSIRESILKIRSDLSKLLLVSKGFQNYTAISELFDNFEDCLGEKSISEVTDCILLSPSLEDNITKSDFFFIKDSPFEYLSMLYTAEQYQTTARFATCIL